MLFAYNETDKEVKMDYKVYNDGKVGTFELTVGDDPDSVVIMRTTSANIMDNVNPVRFPIAFDRNPFIKPMVVNGTKYVYNCINTEPLNEIVCLEAGDDLPQEEIRRRKFMSRNMVLLILKKGSRFFFGKSNLLGNPVIINREEYGYSIGIVLVRWHRWRDLKYPMDIKIESADGTGHHKKIVFGTREINGGYNVNNIVVEEFEGSFLRHDTDSGKSDEKDGATDAKKVYYLYEKKPHNDDAIKANKPKNMTTTPYNNHAHKDYTKEERTNKAMKKFKNRSYNDDYSTKEFNGKNYNKNKRKHQNKGQY